MALIHLNFHSSVLGMACNLDAIVPERPSRDRLRMLLLLHGHSDDGTIWQRRTSIERYVDGRDLAVVMPTAHRSYYCDIPNGLAYETFIGDEVPAIARNLFHISDAREDNYVAGLSMGGYGAFKLALRHPERYACAASLSGVMDIGALFRTVYANDPVVRANFGNADPTGGDADVIALLRRRVAEGATLPRLYQCCGTEDFLYEQNVAFRDMARAMPIDYTYDESPGTHNWLFWDANIQKILDWIFK